MRIAKIPIVMFLPVTVVLCLNNGCVAGETSMTTQQEHHEVSVHRGGGFTTS
jgi:hypothetical protein